MRIEAKNLQEAYTLGAQNLNCSVTDINVEIIENPRSGVLGFFQKPGIYEVNVIKQKNKKQSKINDKKQHFDNNQKNNKNSSHEAKNYHEPKPSNSHEAKNIHEHKSYNSHEPKTTFHETSLSETEKQETKYQSNFKDFDDIVDNFNKEHEENQEVKKEILITDEILAEIKVKLSNLIQASSFNISLEEVSKYDDGTIYIKLQGDDCALLIGKEGYRYKAISYLLYNWINSRFGVNIRLEIAEFLKNQEAAISAYLQNIILKIQNTGKAQTKPLDGVLVKIALEQLRAKFPDKYVGIKTSDEGRYVVVSDFYKK